MTTGEWIALSGIIVTALMSLLIMLLGFRRQNSTLKQNQEHLLATFTATTELRLDQLERKMDKHNCLIERMTAVEQSSKSAHHRIDELRDELK